MVVNLNKSSSLSLLILNYNLIIPATNLNYVFRWIRRKLKGIGLLSSLDKVLFQHKLDAISSKTKHNKNSTCTQLQQIIPI